MTDVPLFRRRSHTVLVIEDDSANRQLPASMLTREQYTVRGGAGRQFDPALASAFLGILEATTARPN